MQERIPKPAGRVSLFSVDASGDRTLRHRKHNDIIVEYCGAAAMLFAGEADYRIRGMYFEFENVTTPGDAVTLPTIDVNEGVSHYTGLSASSDRDFIRTALIGRPTVSVEAGYEDYFSGSVGNLLTCYAQTVGTEGIHGKPFTNAANSTIFGAALIAAPVWADRTRDLVIARAYFAAADQLLKEASGQIGLEWQLPFGL